MTTPLLRRSEQLVWLFDDVECCLGQLPPEPSTTITGVAAPDRNLPYYRPQSFVDRQVPDQGWESVARGQLAVASEHLQTRVSVDRASVSGWTTARWCIGSPTTTASAPCRAPSPTAWWFSITATAGGPPDVPGHGDGAQPGPQNLAAQ